MHRIGHHPIVHQRLHRVQPPLNPLDVEQRLQQPLPEQPRAHRREGPIQQRQQAALARALPECAHQLEVAPRGRINHHELLGGVRGDAGQVRQRVHAIVLEVFQGLGRGLLSRGQLIAAEPAQRVNPEELGKLLLRRSELGIVLRDRREMRPARPGGGLGYGRLRAESLGDQNLGRLQPRDLIGHETEVPARRSGTLAGPEQRRRVGPQTGRFGRPLILCRLPLNPGGTGCQPVRARQASCLSYRFARKQLRHQEIAG